MKKFLFSAVIFASLFFSGCLFDNSSGIINGKIVTVDSNGDVYLVKLNNSDDWINARDTGSVELNIPGYQSNSSIRNVYDKELSLVNSDSEKVFDGDSFIRQQNLKVIEEINNRKAAARSAGNSRNIVLGIDTTDYSKKSITQSFYCYAEDTDKENLIKADLMYTGEHCYVYADQKNNDCEKTKLEQEVYERLAHKFDEIYDLEVAVIGDPVYAKRDSDYFCECNEKVFLLITDIYGDVEYSGNTLGYFYQKDLFNKDIYNTSNEKEILYFDANWLQKNETMVYSTLVHEFNHLINYVTKQLNYFTKYNDFPDIVSNDTTYKWTWLTEMLSMTTEDMFQNFLEIDDINSPKERLGKFFSSHNFGFKDWNWFLLMYNEGKLELYNYQKYQLIVYANTYAFGAYLARNYGGVELISEIAKNEYIGEESITKALQKVNPDFYYTDENQNKKLIDFDYAFQHFCMCLINMRTPDSDELTNFGDDYYVTLNRSAGNLDDVLFFTAINNVNYMKNDENKIWYKYGDPKKIRLYNQQADLAAKSFSIHYIGNNLTDFKLIPSEKKQIKYYMIKTE